MKIIYNLLLTSFILATLVVSNKVNAQANNCSNATPLCFEAGGSYTYPNVFDGSTAPGIGQTNPAVSPFYGCLCPTALGLKNPNYFYIKSTAAGAMTFIIGQSSGDVDFVAWGPFTNSVTMCSNLVGTCTSNCSVSHPTCSGGIMDCSHSLAAVETMTLNATAPGQYFMIMITNVQGSSGVITIKHESGPETDCMINCPPPTFTMDGNLASNQSNLISGSTVGCNQPFYLNPPKLSPPGASYNSYIDALTPCISVNFFPYISNLNTRGTVNIFQNGIQTGTLCPTCPGQSIGASSPLAGSEVSWYMGYNDPSKSHSFGVCNTAGAVGPTTVSIKSCWDHNVTLAGPVTWNTSAAGCFTLNVPANTPLGTGQYSITPASGIPGVFDSNSGWAYINPALMSPGTTYTVTYTFNNGKCGDVHGYYIFTIPALPVITPVSSQTVCSGSPVAATNFTLTPAAGGTVSWVNSNSGIGITTSGVTNIGSYTAPNVLVPTVGVFTVSAVSNACKGNAKTFSITINPKPQASAGSSSTLTCINTTAVLSGSGGAGSAVTYSWSGPAGIIGGSTATPTVNSPGTYSLIVTTLGCASSVSTVVINQNITVPTLTMPSTKTITCGAPTVTLIASANPSNCVPAWTGGVSSGVNSFTATASSANNYVLTITNPVNGCTATGTTQVVPSAGFPSVTASATNPLTCVTTTGQVIATTTTTPVSYAWSGPGIMSGASTATANVNAGGQYTVVVQNTSSLCTSTITIGVASNTTITVPTISPTSAISCSTTSLTLSGSPSIAVTYTWSGAGIVGNTNSQNVTINQGGVYTLSVTNSNGCIGTKTISVSTNTTTPTFTSATAPTVTTTCSSPNATLSLTSSADPNSVYTWTTPSGSTLTANPLITSVGGVYSVAITNTINGCSVASTFTVDVQTSPPQGVDAGGFADIACGNTTVILNGVTTTTNTTYVWAGPSPTSILSGGTTLNPTVDEQGNYTLTVTNTLTGCSASAVVNVTQSTVTASITANPTTGFSPLLVDFNGSGVSASSFNWNFGDGNTATTQNTNNTYASGSYTVTLTTTSGTCAATATVVIIVEAGFTIEIPNVFTPNGDNSNDVFTIKSTGVRELYLQIFNRWGEKLYEFSGPKASWDGIAPNGVKAPEGTYFFFIKATGFDGSEIDKRGTVNLFR